MQLLCGWTIVPSAAWAMVATLPERTMGLGLIAESLLNSSSLDQASFGAIDLVSVLLGVPFCVPLRAALDRYGARWTFLAAIRRGECFAGDTLATSRSSIRRLFRRRLPAT